ncbi:hypothetical protein BGZ95_011712 [Linnemannia exigua]|uniref:Uncharacterized protein n=1 Tax=Linnemannia exigua TaxID=604196 RepID=A0AAD4DJR4_9FUNG|nr:hypothetical protein BGZ95_011712 [Linnemannia exigua]
MLNSQGPLATSGSKNNETLLRAPQDASVQVHNNTVDTSCRAPSTVARNPHGNHSQHYPTPHQQPYQQQRLYSEPIIHAYPDPALVDTVDERPAKPEIKTPTSEPIYNNTRRQKKIIWIGIIITIILLGVVTGLVVAPKNKDNDSATEGRVARSVLTFVLRTWLSATASALRDASHQDQDKKRIYDASSTENMASPVMSLSQLPAYPLSTTIPQQYHVAVAPTVPSTYQHQMGQQLHDYAEQEHSAAYQNHSSYNSNGHNYLNNTTRSYPMNHSQEEMAVKGDYPLYIDSFAEEIGYKGEYPPFVEDSSEEGGGGGVRGLGEEREGGGSNDAVAAQASKEGLHRSKTFFRKARNHKRKEFWILAILAVVVLLGAVIGSFIAGKNSNSSGSGRLEGTNTSNTGSPSESENRTTATRVIGTGRPTAPDTMTNARETTTSYFPPSGFSTSQRTPTGPILPTTTSSITPTPVVSP